MTAGGRLASRIVAHILHVASPRLTGSRQLIGESFHTGWIYAAAANGLAVGRSASEDEVRIGDAVEACLGSRSLTTQHSDVVVEADVPGREVLAEKNAL